MMLWFVIFTCASLARLAMLNPIHILNKSDQNQLGLAPVHLWHGVLPRFTILVDPEYNCVEAGSFPDKTDCSRFYTCNIIGEKLVLGAVIMFKSILCIVDHVSTIYQCGLETFTFSGYRNTLKSVCLHI